MLTILSNINSNHCLIGFAVIVITVVLIKRNKRSKNEKLDKDRNMRTGSTPSLFMMMFKKIKMEDEQVEMVKKNGRVFYFKQMGYNNIIISDPDIIATILSKEFTKFTNRMNLNMKSDPISDNFLSIVRDDHWKRLRAIVSPTFSTGKLRKMRPLLEDCLQTMVKNLDNLSKEAENNEIDVKKVFGAYTMEVIIQVAFGTKVDALVDDDNPIILKAKKIFNTDINLIAIIRVIILMTLPRLAKLLGIKLMPTDVIDFFTKLTIDIIEERKKTPDVKRHDFLQLLLDAKDNKPMDENDETVPEEQQVLQTHNKYMSEAEMISQCVLFFLAGYETTATTITIATYFMAEHQEYQQKLYEESKKIFDSKVDINYDLIERLEFLNAFLSETLRLYPPAIVLQREASEDVVLGEEGMKALKGDVIQIPVYSLHKDSTYFEDPDTFKPERFLPENQTHHPYAYLPFGAGPRNCVARRMALMEAKLALLYAVYNFKFSIGVKTDRPPKLYQNLGLLVPKSMIIKVDKRLN